MRSPMSILSPQAILNSWMAWIISRVLIKLYALVAKDLQKVAVDLNISIVRNHPKS